ncbi:MAG TPA: DUF4434 domain-containing protein [Candidatus Bathyarchaeia archaeon]|nr:DUF4434 domain-containing protein [Candidatus Bathyarchaeia archaeon]
MITRRLFIGTAVLAVLACGATRVEARERAAPRPPITGTFIQYQDWMMKLDEAAWRRELDAMRRAGISVVIVQWLQLDNASFIPRDERAPDPTRVILEYADTHDMRVYVGLSYADFWWKRLRDEQYLYRAFDRSAHVAREAWKRYGRHRSFSGWYLPQEIKEANYPPQYIIRLHDFLKRLGDYCRSLSGGKPVAIAPAMLGLNSLDQIQREYTALLLGSGVDILILQDGIGARDWGPDLENQIAQHFSVVHNACRTAGVAMWSDVEIFRHGATPAVSVPAPIARIRKQIAAEAPFVTSFVMFDFFHYMSPYRGEAQKRLYDDYLREFVTAGETGPHGPPAGGGPR